MRRQAGYTPFMILAPLVVLSVMVAFWIAAAVRHALNHVPQIVQAQLTAALGREVRIGKVEGDFWNGIVVHDIFVARSAKPSDGALLRVPRARVRYSLDAVLQQREPPLESIRSIELERPWIFISRDAHGRLNLQDLVKPGAPTGKKAKPQRFLATVAIRNGTVLFADHQVRGGPIRHHFTGINVNLDPRATPLVVASLQARGDPGRLDALSVQASIDAKSKTVSATVNLKAVRVVPWMAYIPPKVRLPVKPEAGVVDARLSVLIIDGKPADYRGQVTIRDAALRVPKLREPLRGLGGTFEVAPDMLMADDLRVRAGKLSLAGKATIVDFKKPWVRAQLASTGVREADVRALVPGIPALPGVRLGQVTHVQVSVAGPVSNPSGSIGLDLASVARPEATLSNVHLEARLEGPKSIRIDELKGQVAGGSVCVGGAVDLTGKVPRYAVRGSLRGIHLDAVNLAGRLPKGVPAPAGVVSADFEASGVGAKPKAHVRLDVTDAAWREWRVPSARADCVYREGTVAIRRVDAQAPEGRVTATGSVDLKGPVKAEVAATEVDVTALARRFKLEKLQGKAHVHGTVSGTLKDPAFSGEVAAYNVAWGEDRLDMIRAKIAGNLQEVRVEQCTGLYLPAQLGGLTATLKEPKAGAKAHIEASGALVGLDIGRLCKRFHVEGDWGGTVVVDEFLITGPLNALRIEALVTARNLSGAGRNIEQISGRVAATTDGAVEVAKDEPLTIQTGSSEVQVWGTVSAKRELDLWVATPERKSLEIEDFQSFDPAVLSLQSRLSLSLHVTGPATDPRIEGRNQKIHELVVNGHPFGPGDVDVSISKTAVRVDNLVLIGDVRTSVAGQREQYELNGTVWPQKDLNLTGRVVAAPIAELMQVARAPMPPFPVRGRVTALVKVRQGERRPMVNLTRLDVSGGSIGPQQIQTLRAEGIDLTSEAVVVNSLNVALPEGATLRVGGRAALAADGPIELDVKGDKLDLSLLQPWVSLGKPIGGMGVLEAHVTGTREAPVLDGSVTVNDPRYGEVFQLDQVAARLSFRDSIARVTDLVVKKNEYRASGYAELPVDWDKKRIASDAPIKAHVGFEEQNLAALSLFSPKIARADGSTSVSLDVGGTLADPDLRGRVLLKCKELLVVNPRAGQEPEQALFLHDIDGDIHLERDRIVVDHVRVANADFPEDPAASKGAKGFVRKVKTAGKSALGLLGIRFKRDGGGAKADPDALRLSGEITLDRFLPEEFRLKLVAKDFQFEERNLSGQFQEKVQLALNGETAVTGRWPQPLLKGALAISRAKVDVQGYAPVQKVAEARQPLAVDPRLNLAILTDGEVEVIAARTRVYAQGSLDGPPKGKKDALLRVTGSLGEPVVEGTVNLVRGGVDVSTAYFRLNKGEVGFGMDPGAGFSAVGNIELASNIRGKNPRTGKEESFAVTAKVDVDMPNAPGQQFVMKLEASPSLDRDAILSLLTRKDVLEGLVSGKSDAGVEETLKREAANLFATALQPRILEPLERTVAGLLHLNEFSIRASFEEPVEVKVGKHLVKNLRVSYTRAVSAKEARYKFKVDYDLLEGLSLSWSTDEQRSRTVGLEAGLQF